ncbi:hypothetical protein BS50DRAFT_448177, partial [Corynespora cassiicola Philippines]
EEETGAMTRRLRDMSNEALETGGRDAQKAMAEAGFSEQLKRQLEERIAAASFRSEHRSAFTHAELPSTASRHTRDLATAEPWAGAESVHDASLRMLNDAHKPIKIRSQAPTPSVPLPKSIDTGRPNRGGSGLRLANAKDRSGIYSSLKDSDIDEQEREKRFQQLKDRFSPHARAVTPGTIQGLASLANERIEDAIARGQFKNLPRGKKLERDYNASNPFLDTTEYFMNKIIQKQEIVPPWIEKQQELVATASKFRSRLRSDWKRHAARVISSKGGTLQEQMARAEAYAQAELGVSGGDARPPAPQVQLENATWSDSVDHGVSPPGATSSQTTPDPIPAPRPSSVPSAPRPFRDPQWEANEAAYHKLAIEDLNSKTRSYNLQAPDLAKKPYFSLQRELNSCYADVAPRLAEAIKERALRPQAKAVGFGESLVGGGTGVMNRLAGEKVKVRDERVERRYGFRQFWKDIW